MAQSKKEALLRRNEVEARVGISRSQLYAMVKSGEFPAPIELVGRSRAWVESEVAAWITARIEAGRKSARQ